MSTPQEAQYHTSVDANKPVAAAAPAPPQTQNPPPPHPTSPSSSSSSHRRHHHHHRDRDYRDHDPPLPYHRSEIVPPDEWENTFGPTRRWKKGIFDCWDIVCLPTPLCCMSCCRFTHTLLLGQIAERMGLNFVGQYSPQSAHNTCTIVTILWIVYLGSHLLGLSVFLAPLVVVWLLILGIRIRQQIRTRFDIQPEYCVNCCGGNGCCEDCLCTFCCSCCAAIQMSRQTHNEHKYPYQFATPTGLPTYAPILFEQPPPPSPPPPSQSQQQQQQQQLVPTTTTTTNNKIDDRGDGLQSANNNNNNNLAQEVSPEVGVSSTTNPPLVSTTGPTPATARAVDDALFPQRTA